MRHPVSKCTVHPTRKNFIFSKKRKTKALVQCVLGIRWSWVAAWGPTLERWVLLVLISDAGGGRKWNRPHEGGAVSEILRTLVLCHSLYLWKLVAWFVCLRLCASVLMFTCFGQWGGWIVSEPFNCTGLKELGPEDLPDIFRGKEKNALVNNGMCDLQCSGLFFFCPHWYMLKKLESSWYNAAVSSADSTCLLSHVHITRF